MKKKINSLFDNPKDINIKSILTKYGIENTEEFFNGMTVESIDNYDNIKEWCEKLHEYIGEN